MSRLARTTLNSLRATEGYIPRVAPRLGASARVPNAYLARQGPFHERLPWLILVGQFLIDFHLMVERWADWAAALVDTWPDDITAAPPDWETLQMQATVTNARVREP